ncbi:TetR/AcrR family transcriptional regulator [Cryptosporangium japonicum]|uniref:TetR/AcrR family transcriptional regulator n=1 Tax=Cryptosporangium japonicum TaxID=80872 RepID=UPI0031D118F6
MLRGARQCLIERGWARTTVRDIAEAAGVNHAAIGYHFGSKDALLTQALVEAMEQLSAELAEQSRTDGTEARWQALIDTFTTHRRLWVAQLEAAVQAEHSPEIRRHLAEGQREGREGLGGSVPLALVTGLMLQWLVDPAHAPDAAEALAGVRTLAADLVTGDRSEVIGR